METRNKIVERLVLRFKETIPDMVKNLLAKFVDTSMDEENFSVDRLKQLQGKQKPTCEVEGNLNQETVMQSQSGVVHWCGNGDRFMTQDVRREDQLGGVGNMFEIDPMSKLPDESFDFQPL